MPAAAAVAYDGNRPSAPRPTSGAAGSPIGTSWGSATATAAVAAANDDDDDEDDDDDDDDDDDGAAAAAAAAPPVTPRSTAGDGVWRQRLSKPDLMACLYEPSLPNDELDDAAAPAAAAAPGAAAEAAGDFVVGGAARGDRNAVRFFCRNSAPLWRGSIDDEGGHEKKCDGGGSNFDLRFRI